MKVARVESRESSEVVKSYRDLLVWQKSMDLLVDVYEAIAKFPADERYGLSIQIKRAAVSIPSNIAEGSSRRGTKEFLRYINIPTDSLAELETQLMAAKRLKFLSAEIEAKLLKQTDEISRMLQGLYNSLEAKLTRLSILDSNH